LIKFSDSAYINKTIEIIVFVGLSIKRIVPSIYKRRSGLMKFGLTPWRSTSVSSWDPFDEMRRMQERLNRLFGEEGTRSEMMDIDTLAPLVDIKEKDNNIIVTTDLPGVDKKDIDIDIRDNKVWISANTHKES
jgi:Molecular chaperone (small heat shock protein)